MFDYEQLIQCRTIHGTITRNAETYSASKKLINGSLLSTYFNKGTGTNPTALSLKKLMWNGKLLLDPDFGIMVDPKENLMRGHLMKAAWDGGNADDRITQWRNDRPGAQEKLWTTYEENVENHVAQYAPPGSVIPLTTNTVDSQLPATLLLGNETSFKKQYPVQSGNTTTPYPDIHAVLSRQIQSATIDATTGGHILTQTISCPECETGLQLNPKLDRDTPRSLGSKILTGLGIGLSIGAVTAAIYGLKHFGVI